MLQRIGLELKHGTLITKNGKRKILSKKGNYQLQTGKEEFAYLLKWLEEKGIPWSTSPLILFLLLKRGVANFLITKNSGFPELIWFIIWKENNFLLYPD
jgi:hypothetical protein